MDSWIIFGPKVKHLIRVCERIALCCFRDRPTTPLSEFLFFDRKIIEEGSVSPTSCGELRRHISMTARQTSRQIGSRQRLT